MLENMDWKQWGAGIAWSLIALGAVFGIGWCVNSQWAEERNKTQAAAIKKAETERQKAEDTRECTKVIDAFLARKYPKWIVLGQDASLDDLPASPIHVHLQKDKEDKVITLVLSKFYTPDQTPYWSASEPSKIELGNLEIDNLKSAEYKDGQQNAPDPDE